MNGVAVASKIGAELGRGLRLAGERQGAIDRLARLGGELEPDGARTTGASGDRRRQRRAARRATATPRRRRSAKARGLDLGAAGHLVVDGGDPEAVGHPWPAPACAGPPRAGRGRSRRPGAGGVAIAAKAASRAAPPGRPRGASPTRQLDRRPDSASPIPERSSGPRLASLGSLRTSGMGMLADNGGARDGRSLRSPVFAEGRPSALPPSTDSGPRVRPLARPSPGSTTRTPSWRPSPPPRPSRRRPRRRPSPMLRHRAAAVPRRSAIPIRTGDLVRLILAEPGLPQADRAQIGRFARMLGAVFHYEYFQWLVELKDLYAPLDPDSDCAQIAGHLDVAHRRDRTRTSSSRSRRRSSAPTTAPLDSDVSRGGDRRAQRARPELRAELRACSSTSASTSAARPRSNGLRTLLTTRFRRGTLKHDGYRRMVVVLKFRPGVEPGRLRQGRRPLPEDVQGRPARSTSRCTSPSRGRRSGCAGSTRPRSPRRWRSACRRSPRSSSGSPR